MAKGENTIGVGAVLAIPLGDGRWTLSQVYWPGVVFFLLVFNNVSDTLPSRPVISGSPILGSWTNDAEVYRGNWRLLTNLPVAAGIFAEPEYSVLIGGEPFVESFDGRAFRPRVAGDELLKNRKSRSPLLVEDATRSFFGLQDWAPHYDDMLLAPTA
ncbi:MAG: immunity 26/phosphotriesterase HocA family protein [Proteobacteria bacterium]|nr:immunity 26/phosphotriesterase HocA family protein [Pseudomonadota bacterium]